MEDLDSIVARIGNANVARLVDCDTPVRDDKKKNGILGISLTMKWRLKSPRKFKFSFLASFASETW